MSRPVKRPLINHTEIAAQLRTQPGVWSTVGEYPSSDSAESAARRIRTSYNARMYAPAGAFEARTERTEFGAQVIARYVGTPARKPKGSTIQPMRDHERVLGQIERGEIWCGPDAARAIAARQEEAYGAAFTRPTTENNDTAWADALAAVSKDGAE